MLTFFTVSYAGDAARFTLLRRSMLAFCEASFKHYVIVPQTDVSLFRKLADDDGAGETHILPQEEFLSRRYLGYRLAQQIARRVPGQAWRLSAFVGRPGWIRQQIVKLSVPQVLEEEQVIVIDSDVFFIRRFGAIFFMEKPSRRLLLKRNGVRTNAVPKSLKWLRGGHIKRRRPLFTMFYEKCTFGNSMAPWCLIWGRENNFENLSKNP